MTAPIGPWRQCVIAGEYTASPHLGVAYAIAAALTLTVGLTFLARRRVQSFNLTGDEERLSAMSARFVVDDVHGGLLGG